MGKKYCVYKITLKPKKADLPTIWYFGETPDIKNRIKNYKECYKCGFITSIRRLGYTWEIKVLKNGIDNRKKSIKHELRNTLNSRKNEDNKEIWIFGSIFVLKPNEVNIKILQKLSKRTKNEKNLFKLLSNNDQNEFLTFIQDSDDNNFELFKNEFQKKYPKYIFTEKFLYKEIYLGIGNRCYIHKVQGHTAYSDKCENYIDIKNIKFLDE